MRANIARWMLPAVVTILGAGALAEESSHGEHGEAHHGHKNLVAGFIGITGKDRRDRAITWASTTPAG